MLIFKKNTILFFYTKVKIKKKNWLSIHEFIAKTRFQKKGQRGVPHWENDKLSLKTTNAFILAKFEHF